MILSWDEIGQRLYETGVRHGVLYVRDVNTGLYPLGVAWNGLTAVTESPSGAEATPLYADDLKYINLISAEEFGATIEAYTYPDEFAACDGSDNLAIGVVVNQQIRSAFGMCYRTSLGNDTEGVEYGYKLHLIYGAMAAPSEKGFASINDTPEAITFSWEVTTTPVDVTGLRPTASLTIDSTKADVATLATLEDILFGTAGVDARLPLPDEIAALFVAGEPAALALSVSSPLDNAIDVAITANIVLTFNNAILHESIVVTDAAGVIVAGAKTWDATAKIFTFNPTASLVNSTVYLVIVTNVADIYSQTLAVVVNSFTTVAP